MAQQLELLDPILPPDPGRPTMIPSPPAWIVSALNVLQPDQAKVEGKWRDIHTLPADRQLTDGQRLALSQHVQMLSHYLDQTGAKSDEADQQLLALIEELMHAKPTKRAGETTFAARTTAYVTALEDVPVWAVREAIRLWYRGEAHSYGQEAPDYTWAPESVDLRRIALIQTWVVAGRRAACLRLLGAVQARPEPTPEEREANLAKLHTIVSRIGRRRRAQDRLDRMRRSQSVERFREQQKRVVADAEAQL